MAYVLLMSQNHTLRLPIATSVLVSRRLLAQYVESLRVQVLLWAPFGVLEVSGFCGCEVCTFV